MPNYNQTLQTNNSSLEEIITQLNNMPDAGEQATPTISVNNSNGLITATAGTKSSTYQMAFQPAQTITPGTTNKTIAANTYLGGVQTIKGDANLVASNIVSGKSIFGVVGTASAGGGGDTSAEDGLITKTLTTYTNDRVKTIREYAFYNCFSLTSVSFPVCTSINSNAFRSCYNLTSVSFPVCTSIREYAFYNCSGLTSISFPVCTDIGSYAFYNCQNLTSVSFPVCTDIDPNAFKDCYNLTSISFPVCTDIGSYAFQYCYNLTSVSFPACTSIGSYAFQNCSKLSIIYLGCSKVCTLIGSSTFSGTGIWSDKGSIFVRSSLVSAYQSSYPWSYFSNRIYSYNFT